MKKALSILLVLSPALASAQILQGLPVDSATGKVTYQQVVQVAGATKAQLYTKAREWAATEFKSANDVIQMDDKEAGSLVIKGFVPRAGYSSVTNFWRTIKIYTKDGRYRYEITDFTLTGPSVRYASNGIFEKEVEIASAHGKMKEPKGNYKFLLDGVAQTTEAEVASLRRAMAAPSKADF